MQCIICALEDINTVFLKCGHMVYCNNCIKEKKINQCPICQIKSDYIKTYISGYTDDINDKKIYNNNKNSYNKRIISETSLLDTIYGLFCL